MVMREALGCLLIGLGVGTVLVLVAGHGIESLLFGFKPHDPAVLFGSIGLLAVIAAFEPFLPAQRAEKSIPWWRCGTSEGKMINGLLQDVRYALRQ